MAADADLEFVDPSVGLKRCQAVIWAPSGFGKTGVLATAPAPILALTRSRPGALRFARSQHPAKDIRETRYRDLSSLSRVYRYLQAHGDEIETVAIDPFQPIFDLVVRDTPRRSDGDVDWNAVQDKILGFLGSLREFDVHVVICAQERLSDARNGDGKLYPALGGPSLINKIMDEVDIVASLHPEYDEETGAISRVVGALHPNGNLVNKEGTGAGLPARMEANLTEWFALATAQPEREAEPVAAAPVPRPRPATRASAKQKAARPRGRRRPARKREAA